jgi:hypothetical protein
LWLEPAQLGRLALARLLYQITPDVATAIRCLFDVYLIAATFLAGWPVGVPRPPKFVRAYRRRGPSQIVWEIPRTDENVTEITSGPHFSGYEPD